MSGRHRAIGAGLTALSVSGIGNLLRPWTQGLGAILMFHRVRPHHAASFDPHRALEIEPAFLDAVIGELRREGWDILSMDEVGERLRTPAKRPFAVLTFDDGYRDNVEHALPILRRHGAPFTIFVTAGFASGEAPLWWLDLAESVRNDSDPAKSYAQLHRDWRDKPDLLQRIAARSDQTATLPRTRANCLGWDELAELAADPLCTIGAHTVTHPVLATLTEEEARAEVVQSRSAIQAKLGKQVRHFAYPVGARCDAGPREFRLAREAGFETAVTTRPGMLFQPHADHMQALPRLPVDGRHQSMGAIRALLSGAPFALRNLGRRLDVA